MAAPQELDPQTELINAMRAVAELFQHDASLDVDAAMHHGVKISGGNTLKRVEKGKYNLRVPDKHISNNEFSSLTTARSVVLLCIDYRQSYEVAESFVNSAVLAVDGGAGQPDTGRNEALVNFFVALHKVNPNAQLYLGVHTGVCGGVNAYSGGRMVELYSQDDGVEAEEAAMRGYAEEFANQLIGRGVDPSRVNPFIAGVNNDNVLEEIVQLTPSR